MVMDMVIVMTISTRVDGNYDGDSDEDVHV